MPYEYRSIWSSKSCGTVRRLMPSTSRSTSPSATLLRRFRRRRRWSKCMSSDVKLMMANRIPSTIRRNTQRLGSPPAPPAVASHQHSCCAKRELHEAHLYRLPRGLGRSPSDQHPSRTSCVRTEHLSSCPSMPQCDPSKTCRSGREQRMPGVCIYAPTCHYRPSPTPDWRPLEVERSHCLAGKR